MHLLCAECPWHYVAIAQAFDGLPVEKAYIEDAQTASVSAELQARSFLNQRRRGVSWMVCMNAFCAHAAALAAQATGGMRTSTLVPPSCCKHTGMLFPSILHQVCVISFGLIYEAAGICFLFVVQTSVSAQVLWATPGGRPISGAQAS